MSGLVILAVKWLEVVQTHHLAVCRGLFLILIFIGLTMNQRRLQQQHTNFPNMRSSLRKTPFLIDNLSKNFPSTRYGIDDHRCLAGPMVVVAFLLHRHCCQAITSSLIHFYHKVVKFRDIHCARHVLRAVIYTAKFNVFAVNFGGLWCHSIPR